MEIIEAFASFIILCAWLGLVAVLIYGIMMLSGFAAQKFVLRRKVRAEIAAITWTPSPKNHRALEAANRTPVKLVNKRPPN